MGVVTGVVKGGEFKKNKDGENRVLMLQVEITDPDDVQSIQFMTQSGEDTNPEDGANVTVVSISEAFKIAIASNDGVEPSMGKGEKKVYSVLNKAVSAFINFLSGGNIELNGSSGSAVRYQDLLFAFNELKNDFNNLVIAYNSAVYTIGGVGTTGTTSTIGVQSSADMTPSEVPTVRVA